MQGCALVAATVAITIAARIAACTSPVTGNILLFAACSISIPYFVPQHCFYALRFYATSENMRFVR